MSATGRLGEQPWVVRPRSAWVYPGLVTIVAVPITVSAFYPGTRYSIAIALSAITAVWLAWAYFWRPHVRVTRDEVTIVNPWRTIIVPWGAIEDVETRFFLTLVTAAGRFMAAAAPAPGGRRAFTPKARSDVVGPRPSDLVGSDSGDVARVIRDHLAARTTGTTEAVTVRVTTPVLVVTAIGVLASAAAWLTA